MVRKIYLEKRDPTADALIGKFLDDSHYDVLVTEDCDVYAPLSGMESEHGDHNLLLSLRKNVFPMDLVHKTWQNIRGAAVSSDNRGLSAGQIDAVNHPRARLIFTDEQDRVLRALMKRENGKLFDEEIVYDPTEREVRGTRFLKWKEYKMEEEGFVFEDWVKKTLKLSPPECAREAERVYNDLVSETTYANPVFSGIAGYYDRYIRIPYCRETAFTGNNFDKFKECVPFIEAVSDQFALTTPLRHAAQLAAAENLDQKFRVGQSAYTTITVNKNYRTAVHTDAGDLTCGFGNLTVVTGPDCPDWEGSYLVFPHYRVAVDVKPGDMLAMNVHEFHGNTEISGPDGFERISMVCYFREGMVECLDKGYEDIRKMFVDFNMKNKEHPLWTPKWNGIYASMFESKEWFEFLRENGREDMIPKTIIEEKPIDLSDFF